jgi:hypothetical protein
MENKVIAKEYVDKNYIHKDVFKQFVKELKKDEYEDDGYYIAIEKMEKFLEDK